MRVCRFFFIVHFFFCNVAFLNAQSPFIWARAASNPPNQNASEGWAVAADKKGNAFATGQFACNYVSFGAYTLNNPNGMYGFSKLYLVKYDSIGNISWAKTISGEQQSVGKALACDDSGNVYLAGFLIGGSSISFPPLTIPNSSVGKFFLAKYDPNGNALWVRASGTSYCTANAVTVDKSGNIYLGATSSDTVVVFDTISVNSTYPGASESYLARYNSAGHAIWVRHFGDNHATVAEQLSADTSGNIYLAGRFSGAKMIIANDTLHNAGVNSYDIYITKFSATGNYLWSKAIGGTGSEMNPAIRNDNYGHLYAGGNFSSNTIMLGTTTFTNAGAADAFLLRMKSADGTVAWARTTGGVNGDYVHSICADSTGHIFFTGGFDIASLPTFPYEIHFGTDTLRAMTGSADPAFIVEMDSAGTVIHSANMQSGGDDMLAITRVPFSSALYISGDAIKNPWQLGNDTLSGGTNSNEYIFTAKVDLSKSGFYQIAAWANGTNCMNPCSGTATSYPSGGTPPYTFHWLPGNQTGASITNLCAGNYTVTVKDANLDSATSVVNVAYIYLGPVINTTVTPVSCNGLCDGSYTMAITDAGGAMTYSIFNYCGTTTGLCAGPCVIMVTDNNGCSAKDTVHITQPPPITATLSSVNATCAGCADGSISLTAGGGIPGYTYLWQAGNYSTPNISGLSPGIYTCCVTDANGCQKCFVDTISFSLGLFQHSKEAFSISPNPAADKLFLQNNQDLSAANKCVTIQNAFGQTLIRVPYSYEINVSELLPGCYIISLHDGEKIVSRLKFIKQ